MGNHCRKQNRKKPELGGKNQQQERKIDLRQQLYNEGKIGSVAEFQFAGERTIVLNRAYQTANWFVERRLKMN